MVMGVLLLGLWVGLTAAPPQGASVDGPWEFAKGAAGERLRALVDQMPPVRETVSLPHRVLAPNTALWYAAAINLPANSALEVDADDGAQVFVDGKLVERYRRWFFPPSGTVGRRQVTIRVLNNAVQGGLRRVAVVDARRIDRGKRGTPGRPAGFPRVESEAFRRRMPGPAQPCAFSAWSDSHSRIGLGTFRRLIARMSHRPAAFSVGVGDLVSDGSDPEAWPALVEALAPLAAQMPVVPIAGNHDYDGYYNDLRARQYERWFDRGDRTWFAWSCGPVRLVALDLNREFPIGISAGSPQRRWLDAEVRSRGWTSARWRVVLVHQPPWSRSWPGYDGDEAIRRIVEPLARDHGLDAVISGHSHAYEHLVRQVGNHPLHILITGGAGGALEPIAAESLSTTAERIVVRHHVLEVSATVTSLTVEAVDVEGASVDRVVLSQR